MNTPYWQQQTPAKPLYPDIAWNKPQQRAQAGKLGIIGGNRLSFRAIEHSYTTALATGVGQARVVLPDALRGTIPASVTDTIFAASNSSGSLGNEAWPELQALTGWADALLLIGDAGRNSQTAIVYEKLVSHTTAPLIISRDAVDLLMPSAPQLASQSNILIIASFSQVQKLLRTLYYPKILTFRMPLLQLVETLHKFTITYPLTLATFHADTILIAQHGTVTSTPWSQPMALWQGTVPTRIAAYTMWNPATPLQAATASLLDGKE